jgi:hypothetical protein
MNREELHQRHGKNSRIYLIEEDRLVITTKVQDIERKATIPYDVGLISFAYDETVMAERTFFGPKVGVLLGISLVGMFSSFAMFARGEKDQAWILPGILILAASMAGLIWGAIRSQPRNVGALRLYIGNGQFYLYGRNDQDKHQAEDFIHKLFDAQKAYFRNKYLAPNEAMTDDQVKTRLSWLYENKLIDHQELTLELEKLKHE